MSAKIKIVFGSERGNPYDAAYTEKITKSTSSKPEKEEEVEEGEISEKPMAVVDKTGEKVKSKTSKSAKDRFNEGLNRIFSKKSEDY